MRSLNICDSFLVQVASTFVLETERATIAQSQKNANTIARPAQVRSHFELLLESEGPTIA